MKYLKKAKQKIAWERFYSNDFEWDKEQFYIDHVFSEEFLTEFFQKINWRILLKYQDIDENFFVKHKNSFNYISYVYSSIWETIVRYQTFSEDTLKILHKDLPWQFVCQYQKLSENFIRNFICKKLPSNSIGWNELSRYQKLSENFIRKYKDKVDWLNISRFQNLSEAFIKKFDNKVSHFMILVNHETTNNLSNEYAKACMNRFNITMYDIAYEIEKEKDFAKWEVTLKSDIDKVKNNPNRIFI